MDTIVRNITNQLKEKPKMLFLIDSIGALLTTVLLFLVLKNLNKYIGMPQTVLTYLALIAFCFCIYSTACFFLIKQNWTPFIRGIGIANLFYCIITSGLLILNSHLITNIGLAYFSIEIVLICFLVYIELKVASEIARRGQASLN